jgi:hypothetical protein
MQNRKENRGKLKKGGGKLGKKCKKKKEREMHCGLLL